ncbi:MAG: ATP-grasp domain-containing protein [Bacteroidales bacterium]|nr:ATP-grasp domain-containing protein [Bacteroidales bacterium]
MNVLVLGAGGNVSQGIITALKLSGFPCRIIGACVSFDSLGLYFCDAAYISPYANDAGFVEWVINLCNKEQVDIVMTGVEENILVLERERRKFETGTKAKFVSCDEKQLSIGANKLLTARWLEQNGCHFPLSAGINDEDELRRMILKVGFPLIAKPNSGKGSHGIVLAHSMADLTPLMGKDYCVQEYLGTESEEYTIGCYADHTGKMCEMIILHRELKHGTTFMAEVVENDDIRKECMKICSAFKPKGPLNIQLRLHNGKPVCFELNVRFSGTTPIRARFGYNDVAAMIEEYVNGGDPEKYLLPLCQGKVYRYYNEAYIDEAMQEVLKSNKEVQDCHRFYSFVEGK